MPNKETTHKFPKVEIIDDWRQNILGVLPRIGSLQPVSLITGGMVLPQPTLPTQPRVEVIREVPTSIALAKRGSLSGWGEPPNFSFTLDASRIQAAIRAAERGDVYLLFAIFRDMEVGFTHLQNEFAKRKHTVVGQPHAVLPRTKGNKDDEIACKVINEMIEHADNWSDSLDSMLDATLWPVAVAEKMFAPVLRSEVSDYEYPVRYRMRRLDPVSPTLFCYKIPYLTSGVSTFSGQLNATLPIDLGPEVAWNPNDWEPELRFYSVFQNGYPDFSPASTYAPDKARHIIHRGSNLSKTIRDNFGGHMRAILFWWFLATSARDWFGRYMQRWGHPFVVGKVDVQQKDTVQSMQNALSMAMEIGGLVIDKNAEAMLMQAASLNGAEGYRLFLEVCNDEVSKVVVGQTLSSSAKPTGLGSGTADLQGRVLDAFRQSDMRKLSETLTKQLFRHYLHINGYTGHVKGIIWGGKDEQQVKELSESMKNFGDSGIRPTTDGIEVISERIGIDMERAPIEHMDMVASRRRNGDSGKSKATNGDDGEKRALRSVADNERKKSKNLKAHCYDLEQELYRLQGVIGERNGKNGTVLLVQ